VSKVSNLEPKLLTSSDESKDLSFYPELLHFIEF